MDANFKMFVDSATIFTDEMAQTMRPQIVSHLLSVVALFSACRVLISSNTLMHFNKVLELYEGLRLLLSILDFRIAAEAQ